MKPKTWRAEGWVVMENGQPTNKLYTSPNPLHLPDLEHAARMELGAMKLTSPGVRRGLSLRRVRVVMTEAKKV